MVETTNRGLSLSKNLYAPLEGWKPKMVEVDPIAEAE